MKKLLVVLLFSSYQLITISQRANAQTFQTGSLITSISYGFDVYRIQENEIETYTTPAYSQNVTGGAACGNLNVGGEFGVTNWLGLGLQFKLDSYLHKDTGTTGIEQANGFEYGIVVNFHIVRHLHFDLLGGLNLGGSSLTLTSNDGFNDQVYGKGSWFDIHFTARIYFGKFGVSATLYFPTINYPNLTSNNSTFNTYVIDSWKAQGEGLNIGIQYHFLR